MVKVFLSYSHDTDTHTARVHALADRLAREAGLKVVLDRDTGPGGPDEGWPAWSERQVREADRVLIACSEEYTLRYEGDEGDSARGRGTVIEARAIQQFLYDSKGRNARFRVVLFDASHEEHIPHQLRGYHYFNAAEDAGYRQLVAWLKAGVKDADAPPPEGPVWPKPDMEFKLPLADRRPHFDAVRAALSGQSSSRIFLLEGEGASGKTDFLTELSTYADHLGIRWTLFDFKGGQPIEEFFDRVIADLGDDLLPETCGAAGRASLTELVNDLKRLTTPVLLLFDTFEKASDDSQRWVASTLLPRVRSLPAVVVVIGGRSVPDRARYPWRSLAEFRVLEPIRNPEDWKEYLQRVHPGKLELDESILEAFTKATQGSPGNLKPLFLNLMKHGQ